MVKPIEDFVVNINVASLENFNVDNLLESAEELGIDMLDLVENGFDLEGNKNKCMSNGCVDRNKFKNFDQAMRKSNELFYETLKKNKKTLDMVKCHPWVKK